MENTTEIFAPTEKPKYFAVKAVFILRIGECLLCPILLAFVIVYVRILRSKMFCHPNLRFLLIIQPILHWTVILINVIYNILQMYNFELSETIEDVFSNLSDCFLIQATTIMLPISIERLYATLYPEKYDHIHQEFPILGICLYILIALIAFILCALRDLQITDSEHSYLVILILFTLAAIFFLILPYTSRRLFNETVKMRDCTVSARYQTAENLRSAHLLKYISAWKTLTNFLSLGLYYYCFEIEYYYFEFTTQLYYYWTILQIFCQMLLTTCVHEVLRQELKKLIGSYKSVIFEEKPELRSIIGEKMIFSAHEEREKYFQMYADSWGVDTVKSKMPLP